jgi:hypothetical protein
VEKEEINLDGCGCAVAAAAAASRHFLGAARNNFDTLPVRVDTKQNEKRASKTTGQNYKCLGQEGTVEKYALPDAAQAAMMAI